MVLCWRRMTRWNLPLPALALVVSLAACGGDEQPEPDYTGLYRVEVTGRVGPVEWEAEALPETIALEWPGSLELDVTRYDDEERQQCAEGACWYGNASITVNGSHPEAAFVHVARDGAELVAIMDEGFLVRPVDAGMCDFFIPLFLDVRLLVEGTRAEGSTGGPIECIVTGDDDELLHQYAADVQLTMSGTRLVDPEE